MKKSEDRIQESEESRSDCRPMTVEDENSDSFILDSVFWILFSEF
jgi:hypothetical protein